METLFTYELNVNVLPQLGYLAALLPFFENMDKLVSWTTEKNVSTAPTAN
jgi:hypothetical protein